jgi:hypothetical protein
MCEGLAHYTHIALCYNVNCVMSKKIKGKGEGIPTLLMLIAFLTSFMTFKKTGLSKCFTILDMSLIFICTMSSFRCMKVLELRKAFHIAYIHWVCPVQSL